MSKSEFWQIVKTLGVFAFAALTGFAAFGVLRAIAPSVNRTNAAIREWNREMAETMSPFSCGACGRQLSKKTVLDFSKSPGLSFGLCPHCRAGIHDVRLFQNKAGVTRDAISAFCESERRLFESRSKGVGGGGDGFFLLMMLVLFVAWCFSWYWFGAKILKVKSLLPPSSDKTT